MQMHLREWMVNEKKGKILVGYKTNEKSAVLNLFIQLSGNPNIFLIS